MDKKTEKREGERRGSGAGSVSGRSLESWQGRYRKYGRKRELKKEQTDKLRKERDGKDQQKWRSVAGRFLERWKGRYQRYGRKEN